MSSVLSPCRSLAGKHVILTGVTGFLGKVWLAAILEQLPQLGRVTLLCRGKQSMGAVERIVAALQTSPAMRSLRQRHDVAQFNALIADKLYVLDCDFAQPLCGLKDQEAKWRGADLVVHFAGLTDFEPDPLQALQTNVYGTANLADLARQTVGKRLLHVSTAYVAGNQSGDIAETVTSAVAPSGAHFDPLDEIAQLERACAAQPTASHRIRVATERAQHLGWPNIYTFSKGLAEHLLASRPDVQTGALALSIARPTIVESARRYPFPGWNEGLNGSAPLIWLLGNGFRRLPARPSNIFDVVPVDTVARGITLIASAMIDGEAQPVFHLASGDQNPFLFERAIDLSGLGVRRMLKGPDTTLLQRMVLRHLDAVSEQDPDPFPSLAGLQDAARRVRSRLHRIDLRDTLPPKMYASWGHALQQTIKRSTRSLHVANRTLGRVQNMLRLYQPFLRDNAYRFGTDNIMALSDRLGPDDQPQFGYDINTLDWRHYWLDVHMPGVEHWCLPRMRGEPIPQDPPMFCVLPARSASGDGNNGVAGSEEPCNDQIQSQVAALSGS